MITLTRTFRRILGRPVQAEPRPAQRAATRSLLETPPVDIAPGDPLLSYFTQASGAVELDRLELDSPALRELRKAGVKLVVPLISQGELIGLLNLGPRLSEQEYSTDDKQLLEKLAAQASPAVRVAQLVREQEAEVRARERIEQELRVAQLIQQQFLPKRTPELPGWRIAAFYRAAQEVGGDFYDFIELDDGKLGLVVGDVTGHGVPAALVMATTRSFLRAQGARAGSPAAVLAQANDFLDADIPQNMFVTCLYAVLDPKTGHMRFANAGHDLPYVRTADGGLVELRATGMPLGLMAGMRYEEKEFTLSPGDTMLLHSDGLAEAHGPDREMFGFPRVKGIAASKQDGKELIDELLRSLHRFTGPQWQQEDDITLVTISRAPVPMGAQVLARFEIPSESGNERTVMDRVADVVAPLLPKRELDRLKTAVSEAAMNAIEHGNELRRELPVLVEVSQEDGRLSVVITDKGGGKAIPDAETPDIEAKLAGLQKPRGWGLFLIKNMVHDMRVTSDDVHHTVELVVDLERARKEAGHADR